MKRLPIRWKFTIWFGATLTLLLATTGSIVFLVMRHELLAAVDDGLREEMGEITAEIHKPRKRSPQMPQLMIEETRRRFIEHGVYHFEMDFGLPTRKHIFHNKALASCLPLVSHLVKVSDGPQFQMTELPLLGHCRMMSSAIEAPGGPYVVHVVTTLAPFDQQISRLSTVLLASVPIALVLGVAGGYTLARRALSPVDRIVDVANRITATDLHQRVAIVNPDDELGRLAQTFNSLIDRLQKAIEEMRRFTADAAHELRTPLAVLRSGIEVALRAPRSAADYRQALGSAGEEVNRLTRLADQLLYLSRQEAGMMQMDRDEVRLDALIKDVAEQFEARADEAGVTAHVERLEPWVVRGDDIRLSQVFFNVLDNAIKYTPRGGQVTIRGRRLANRFQVEIEDTGQGIPAEHLPHVFKRFYRVEQSRNAERGGAGLGLAIAQSAVAAHGGTISVRSELGRGTVIAIELPGFEPQPVPSPTADETSGSRLEHPAVRS